MRRLLCFFLLCALIGALLPAGQTLAKRRAPDKDPVAIGKRGAVATVDPYATEAGIRVLRRGGNAVDAAIAAAAALGVTEPYSAGIGGGGFMLIYRADSGTVEVIDGREEAPEDPRFDEDVFLEFTSGVFSDAVNSGLSVGVPGTFATWVEASERFGALKFRRLLQPAIKIARRGFVVDETFALQTEQNRARFAQIEPTAELFLDDGETPEVGSIFRNRDLARTYRLLQEQGLSGFYRGELARDIVEAIQDPPTTDETTEEWQPGFVDLADLRTYDVLRPEPTHSTYRGFDIFGMPPPSSGGITVGETLNILEGFDLSAMKGGAFWHHVIEALALAFADRNAYIADDRYVFVPQEGLLSDEFAAERREEIGATAAPKPVAAGDPCPYQPGGCPEGFASATSAARAGGSTTHLVTADRWGNVVSYTLTIEQTGGSAITVPERGFLLNNELTDFNFTGPSPNLAEPGKRPRSSMSPTIVLENGDPLLAVGTPGGATIITTVVEILLQRIDRGRTLPQALAAPRATQLNSPTVLAEPLFIERFGSALEERGHTLSPLAEIGAATALEFLDNGRILAAAERVRRGGGDAGVVKPTGRFGR
jgi:gamma-glutamyltranspeptidase/glutathione hydrolase